MQRHSHSFCRPRRYGPRGGFFNGASNPFGVPSLTLDCSLIVLNQADGGASTGLGVGGGLYVAPGGIASADLTFVFVNDVSTSDDDVFGIVV